MEYVGILLDSSVFRGIKRGRTGQESLECYELSAALYRLIPCFMRLEDIDLYSGICKAYIRSDTGYKLHTIKLPYIIHNRAMFFSKASYYKIAGLIQQGILIFNVRNRYRKDHIHKLLTKNEELAQHLPDTMLATQHSLYRMMEKHSDLIIKPGSGSIGHGVMRLTKSRQHWTLFVKSKSGKRWIRTKLKHGRAPAFLLARFAQKKHIVQQRIPLAVYENKPFDLRVTIQRGLYGEWGVTGVFAKLAASPQAFVTNVARGGTAVSLDRIYQEVFPDIAYDELLNEIYRLSIMAAQQLSLDLPYIADLGIDLGVTAAGEIYFIECNGRDQRYGFRKAGMNETWVQSYREPMGYARYLLDRKHQAAALSSSWLQVKM
ncbi:YheC/YheD family protein [Neobacillus mesonae]|nr:YheC/YheD family protein [Neobacillus mesonae]